MSDKIGQRFTAHETLETTKLGALVRATDDQLGAPALVLRVSASAQTDDATLAAVLDDNRKLAACPQALLAYCWGRDEAGAWIATEATDGCIAEELLRRRDKLEMPHLLDAALAMAKASAAAAAVDAWVGDLGPHRLWVQGGAAGGKVRTFGYGWWRLLPGVAPGSTAEGFFGAPEYLAAEACKGGSLSSASDVYCAATAVWALAAGKPPFHGPQPLSVIKRQAAEKPLRLDLVKPALKGVKDLQAALADALDKDPAKRPAAATWQQTLQAAVATWGPLPSGDDAIVPQRTSALSGAAGADAEPAPTVVVKIAAEPAKPEPAAAAPAPVAAPAAPEPAAPAPAPTAPAPEPAPKVADPDATAVLAPLKVQASPVPAQPAATEPAAAAPSGEDDDGEDEEDDAAPVTAGGAVDPNRRGKKGKKSRRDRDRGGAPQVAGKSPPTPIASPATRVEPAKPEPQKAPDPVKPAAPVAAVAPAGGAQTKTNAPAPAAAASPTAVGSGRTVKTTDRIRVEAMHESAFFSHNDKIEAARELHDQGPPVAPPQKVNKLLLGTVAAFAVAMVAVAIYIKVNAPPEPPPVPPEGSEAAAPTPAPTPAPAAEPAPEPPPAVPAPDVAQPSAEPVPDVEAAAADVASEVAQSPSDQAARLVDEGQALLRAGTLDKALEKAKEAQALNAGNAQAAALQKQIEQAQADAAASAAAAAAKAEADNKAAAAKAEADNKAAAEAQAKQKAVDEAAAKQAAAAAEKAEAERKKQEEKAAKQAEAERKKQDEQAAKAEAARKKADAEASKADEARRKKEEAAARKAEEERKRADEERKKAAEAEKARKADEARKKKEEAAAKKEASKAPKVEKAEKPPTPPAANEASEGQKEAAKFAALAQKATTAKLKVLYLRKAVDRDPSNGKFKQMLKDAEAELAAQPN